MLSGPYLPFSSIAIVLLEQTMIKVSKQSCDNQNWEWQTRTCQQIIQKEIQINSETLYFKGSVDFN